MRGPTKREIGDLVRRIEPFELEGLSGARLISQVHILGAKRHPVVPLWAVSQAFYRGHLKGWIDVASPRAPLRPSVWRRDYTSDEDFWGACASWLRFRCRASSEFKALLCSVAPGVPLLTSEADGASSADVVAWAAARLRPVDPQVEAQEAAQAAMRAALEAMGLVEERPASKRRKASSAAMGRRIAGQR